MPGTLDFALNDGEVCRRSNRLQLHDTFGGPVRAPLMLTIAGAAMLGSLGFAASQSAHRLNPVVELLAQRKPVFGLYAPSNCST
jgi:hypothetical protein